jgi:hypothetical protein
VTVAKPCVRISSRLSDRQIDDLFGGRLPSPDEADLARFLRHAGETLLEAPDTHVEQEHLAAIVLLSDELQHPATASPAPASTERTARRRSSVLTPVLVRVATTVLIVVVVLGALAAGGYLPDPMQSVVARLARTFGISLEDAESGHRDERVPADDSPRQSEHPDGDGSSFGPQEIFQATGGGADGEAASDSVPASTSAADLNDARTAEDVGPRDGETPGDTASPEETGPADDTRSSTNGNGPPAEAGPPDGAGPPDETASNGTGPPPDAGPPQDAGPPEGAGPSDETASNGNGPTTGTGSAAHLPYTLVAQ